MDSMVISIVALVLLFGGALLGLFISERLPRHHLTSENKEVVMLGVGLVGTIAGIALGLLIGSAYSYQNQQTAELVQVSADVTALGKLLRHYGPEASEARESLRTTVEQVLASNWVTEQKQELKSATTTSPLDRVYSQVRDLPAKDEGQRMIKSEALGLLKSLSKMRLLIVEQTATTALSPLLFVMIFWLTAIFLSWGLFAPRSAAAISTFLVAAICVSCAIFMVVGLYTPYSGLLRISTAPLRLACDSLA